MAKTTKRTPKAVYNLLFDGLLETEYLSTISSTVPSLSIRLVSAREWSFKSDAKSILGRRLMSNLKHKATIRVV